MIWVKPIARYQLNTRAFDMVGCEELQYLRVLVELHRIIAGVPMVVVSFLSVLTNSIVYVSKLLVKIRKDSHVLSHHQTSRPALIAVITVS